MFHFFIVMVAGIIGFRIWRGYDTTRSAHAQYQQNSTYIVQKDPKTGNSTKLLITP
jgi:predicted negative regulator of RcsB-dependent stress response